MIRKGLIGLVVATAVAGCSSSTTPAPAPDPDRRTRGAEAPVMVTVAAGPEHLPVWHRADGRATLVVPADLVFGKDSADLGPAAVSVLDGVLREVETGTGADVLVEGHADGDGDRAHNQDLSERRAAAVAGWLSSNGVDPSAITTRGWGDTRPAVDEIDDAAKAENRRVVITVTVRSQTRSIR